MGFACFGDFVLLFWISVHADHDNFTYKATLQQQQQRQQLLFALKLHLLVMSREFTNLNSPSWCCSSAVILPTGRRNLFVKYAGKSRLRKVITKNRQTMSYISLIYNTSLDTYWPKPTKIKIHLIISIMHQKRI